MAGHLAQKGYEVTVYNRTSLKSDNWVGQYAGKKSSEVSEAVKDADFVFMCLGNDDDVRSVTHGKAGAITHMSESSVLIDHTTASDNLAKELGQLCGERGIGFLDAPVSGGQAGAENAVLTVMLGGDEGTYQKVVPYLDCFAKKHALMGSIVPDN